MEVNSQFKGTFTLLSAVKEVTIVLLQLLQLHQLLLFLLLLLLPLQPQPERLLRVALWGVLLGEEVQNKAVTTWDICVQWFWMDLNIVWEWGMRNCGHTLEFVFSISWARRILLSSWSCSLFLSNQALNASSFSCLFSSSSSRFLCSAWCGKQDLNTDLKVQCVEFSDI